FEMTAELLQSPPGVPLIHVFTWSIAPLAADSALESPRALMTAAPRVCTIGTNVCSSHARSVIVSVAGFPLTFALVKSGYCVFEWLPQTVTLLTAPLGTPAFLASAATARLWSSRVIALHRSAGISRPLRLATRQFVLHGLPTIRMRTSGAALRA